MKYLIIFLLAVSGWANAQTPTIVKGSALNPTTAINTTDELILLQSGQTKRGLVSLLPFVGLNTFSAISPMSYNNITGTFSMGIASGASSGYLTSANWSVFNSKEPGLGTPAANGYVLSSTVAGVRSWIPASVGGVSSVFGRTGVIVAAEGDYSSDQLSDFLIASAATGQLLRFNGTNWVNVLLLDADIPNLDASKITTGAFADARIASAATWNAKENAIIAGTTAQYYRGDKTFQTLDKAAVGLANVDNTTDAAKPISTATQTALNLKQNTVALTTTGTTGVSTFNATTGALNIPNYTTTPAGGTGQIQFNNAGAFGGSSNLTFNQLTDELKLSSANANIFKADGSGSFQLGKVITVGAANLSPNKNFDANITPWVAFLMMQTSTVTWNSGLSGDGSNGYMRYNAVFNAGFERWGTSISLLPLTTYNVRFWYRNSTNTPMRLIICQSLGGGADNEAGLINAQHTTIPNSNGNWLYFNQNITTNSGSSLIFGFRKLTQTQGGGTFDVDAIEIFNSSNSNSPALFLNSNTEVIKNRAENQFGNDTETSVIINQPSTSKSNLILYAKTGQTSKVAEFRNSGNTLTSSIDADGTINASNLFIGNNTSYSNALLQPATTNVNHTVKAIASQTADLTQWQNSSGTVLSKFTATGRLGLGLGATAPDAILHIKETGANVPLIIERPNTGSNMLECKNGSTIVASINDAGSAIFGGTISSNALNGASRRVVETTNGVLVATTRLSKTLGVWTTPLTHTAVSEVDYYTYNIPANTMSTNGDEVIYKLNYKSGNGPEAGTVTAHIYFAGVSVSTFSSPTNNDVYERRIATVTRTGETTALMVVTNESPLTNGFQRRQILLTGLNFGSEIIFKSTIENNGTMDVVGLTAKINFEPAP